MDENNYNNSNKIKKDSWQFIERTSWLDTLESTSPIEKSEFRGFFNLATMGFIFFFITTQVKNILNEGTPAGWSSLHHMFNRHDLFPAWCCLCLSSFSAVILQKLKVKEIITSPSLFFDYSLQIIIFIISILVLFERNWPVVQTSFFVTEMLLIIMKIHSYIMRNNEFHHEYIKNKKTNHQNNDNNNSKKLRYPKNVTFSNFLYFLLVPTLVYEIEYPSTPKIRISYLIEKIISFLALQSVVHVLVDTYITPVLMKSPQMTVLESVSQLIIPFLFTSLLLFYLVFEIGLNAFAELTKFADRQFYSDWWNSTMFDEFSRKWNRPVHEWLLRHVYMESLKSHKFSKNKATILTFFISSVVHEFFLSVTLRLFRPWLFIFQMAQIPLLLSMGKLKGKRLGNYFFWFSIALGPPLISILYCREYFLQQNFNKNL